MGILASRYSRTSALICVGLSQSSAPCRAYACGVVNRPAATRLVPRGLSSYGINRYIESKFFDQNRTWRQRYVLPVQHSTVSCDESAIASKWKFISDDDNTSASPRQRDSLIKNILVCGDGDLSYCAEIAPELERLGIELFATVLEEEDIHNRGKFHRRLSPTHCWEDLLILFIHFLPWQFIIIPGPMQILLLLRVKRLCLVLMQQPYRLTLGMRQSILDLIEFNSTFRIGKAKQIIDTTGEIKLKLNDSSTEIF